MTEGNRDSSTEGFITNEEDWGLLSIDTEPPILNEKSSIYHTDEHDHDGF